jgi:hypothetical protein
MVALVAAVVVTIVALLIISLTVALLGVLGVLMAVPMWAGLVLAMMLITSFFMLNMTRLFLAIARGQRADVATLFRFSPYFWKFFGTQLLLAIIGAVVGILGIIVSLISALAVSSIPLKVLLGFLAMILGGLPALVVGVIFFPSLMLVADRGLKPIDALTEAKRLTTGLWLNLLVILIVAGVLAALFSGLTFGLGMLVAQPFIFLMFQVIYLRLSGQRVG